MTRPQDAVPAWPERFNLSPYYLDRNLDEGRGAKVAVACGALERTYDEIVARVRRLTAALRELGLRPEERVLIVAHEGTNAVILSHLLGIEPVPWASLRFSSGWAGISRVHTIPVASGHIWALDSFNARQHLDGIGDGQTARATT